MFNSSYAVPTVVPSKLPFAEEARGADFVAMKIQGKDGSEQSPLVHTVKLYTAIMKLRMGGCEKHDLPDYDGRKPLNVITDDLLGLSSKASDSKKWSTQYKAYAQLTRYGALAICDTEESFLDWVQSPLCEKDTLGLQSDRLWVFYEGRITNDLVGLSQSFKEGEGYWTGVRSAYQQGNLTADEPEPPASDLPADGRRASARASRTSRVAPRKSVFSEQGFDTLIANEKDPVMRRQWYLKAADRGDAEAMYVLGVVEEAGGARWREWLSRAAEAGCADALFDLGVNEAEPAMQRHFFARAAEKGHVASMYNLGILEQQDKAKRREWFEKAAEFGCGEAMVSLGAEFEADPAAAREWYLKAADQDCTEAMYNLALLEPDRAKAREWYRKAADLGCDDSMFALGVLEPDQARKVQWYTRAAERGHSGAMCNLGVYCELDPVKRKEWYLKSAEKGSVEAMNNLAVIEPMRKKQKEWLTHAAEGGCAEAMFNLGNIEPMPDKQIVLYAKAAQLGHVDAKARLRQLGC